MTLVVKSLPYSRIIRTFFLETSELFSSVCPNIAITVKLGHIDKKRLAVRVTDCGGQYRNIQPEFTNSLEEEAGGRGSLTFRTLL